jgi:hypothetical protein
VSQGYYVLLLKNQMKELAAQWISTICVLKKYHFGVAHIDIFISVGKELGKSR